MTKAHDIKALMVEADRLVEEAHRHLREILGYDGEAGGYDGFSEGSMRLEYQEVNPSNPKEGKHLVLLFEDGSPGEKQVERNIERLMVLGVDEVIALPDEPDYLWSRSSTRQR